MQEEFQEEDWKEKAIEEAEQSKKEDKVELFRFFYPIKSGYPSFQAWKEKGVWQTRQVTEYFLEKKLIKEG